MNLRLFTTKRVDTKHCRTPCLGIKGIYVSYSTSVAIIKIEILYEKKNQSTCMNEQIKS